MTLGFGEATSPTDSRANAAAMRRVGIVPLDTELQKSLPVTPMMVRSVLNNDAR